MEKQFNLHANTLYKLGISVGFINTNNPVEHEKAVLNSYLLAAAPELLKSLQGMLEYAEMGIFDADEIYIAKCVIAKALGENNV